MMFILAALALFIAMVMILIRLFLGESLYDRVLAGSSFGTATVLFIGVLGFLTERPDFLDIALLYALINFVGTIAVLKFFRYRSLGDIRAVDKLAMKNKVKTTAKPKKEARQ